MKTCPFILLSKSENIQLKETLRNHFLFKSLILKNNDSPFEVSSMFMFVPIFVLSFQIHNMKGTKGARDNKFRTTGFDLLA